LAAETITEQLARDLADTLARLRMARQLDPKHEILPGHRRVGCEICVGEARLDWLIDKIPRITGA